MIIIILFNTIKLYYITIFIISFYIKLRISYLSDSFILIKYTILNINYIYY